MIRLAFDPIRTVIDIVQEHYPDLECEINFVNGIEEEANAVGNCALPGEDDDWVPQIQVSAQIPLEGAVETLAHELAHLIAGCTEDHHGEEWRAAFDWIHQEFLKRVPEQDLASDAERYEEKAFDEKEHLRGLLEGRLAAFKNSGRPSWFIDGFERGWVECARIGLGEEF